MNVGVQGRTTDGDSRMDNSQTQCLHRVLLVEAYKCGNVAIQSLTLLRLSLNQLQGTARPGCTVISLQNSEHNHRHATESKLNQYGGLAH